MGRYKKSYRKNAGKKSTWFKMGHCNLPTKTESSTGPDSTTDMSSNTKFTRPNIQEFTDALKVQTESSWICNTSLLPTKLRPEKEKVGINETESSMTSENIIVAFDRLNLLLKAFMPHSCKRPTPNISISRRQGLCISVVVKCINCTFASSIIDLFESYKPARGPDAGTLNTCLVIPVLKTKVGISHVTHMLSCLNIKPPCRQGLQEKVNRLSDLVVKLNEQTLIDNQSYVKKVLEIAGQDNFVDVETDTSYNNRPRAGYEAATQSFCPLIEQTTSRKLPLSVETANKLCSKTKNCEHNSKECKKNYCTHESIASSEQKHLLNHLKKVDATGIIKVGSVISDACAQTEKTVKDFSSRNATDSIRHFKCFVHKLRTFQKHIRYLKLLSDLNGCNKEMYVRKLSVSMRARIRVELIRIKKSSRSESMFVENGKRAIENIVSCFRNDHEKCRQVSQVCTAHLSSYNSNHLPYGKHLQLNAKDIQNIKCILNKNFSACELHKICRLKTTNQCESLHNKVFTFAPKNTIWTRNFSGLCHSAVHSASHGNGNACVMLAKAIGLKYKTNDPFIKQMRSMDQTSKYHSMRKKSHVYKMAQYLAKLKRANRPLIEKSLYATSNENMKDEHGYALKTDFFTC